VGYITISIIWRGLWILFERMAAATASRGSGRTLVSSPNTRWTARKHKLAQKKKKRKVRETKRNKEKRLMSTA
jgi:hypothetical protein